MLCIALFLARIALGAAAQNGGSNAPAVQTPGQDAGNAKPATSQPSAEQAADRKPVMAKVIEVVGDVQHSPIEPRGWQPCRHGDEYPEQTIIRTGVRSSIKLQVGSEEPYTAMIVESVGLTVISEAWKTNAVKRVRVGVGYGTVRAGVAEGGLQSDFTIDSPVATLSKRGTWNFGMYYERGSGRFEVFLLDYGLVDALNKLTGQSRMVLPGQAVTQAMRRWLDEVQIRRNVAVTDIFGQGDMEIAFNRIQQEGLGVLNPGQGNRAMIDLTDKSSQAEFARLVEQASQAAAATTIITPPGQPVFTRPEGFFGTGRGDELIAVVVNPGSGLAKNGHALPGTYNLRRSAAESWLKNYRRN